jgi:biopolymer transport protein TolR
MGTERQAGPTAEINVTPMADIMIVLLIIFMVTAPLIAQSGVALPQARNAQQKGATPIVVILRLDRSLAIEGSLARDVAAVSNELRQSLDGMAEGRRVLYLKADTALGYSDVKRVMDMLRELGADEIGLMTSRRAGA